MAHLTLDQARPGMILAADVMDRRGRLLVPAGRDLSDRHLAALRMWGVPSVEIEGEDPDVEDAAPISPEVVAQAEADVAYLFSNATDEHPFLDALRTLAVDRCARRIAAEGGEP